MYSLNIPLIFSNKYQVLYSFFSFDFHTQQKRIIKQNFIYLGFQIS